MKEIKKSFKNVIQSTKVFLQSLLEAMPWIYLFVIVLSNFIIKLFSHSENISLVLLGILIILMSCIVYIKEGSYAEVSLSFILALIALFSLSWKKSYVVMFGLFYSSFNLLVVMLASIKLAVKKENILTQASLNYKHLPKSHKEIYITLNNMTKTGKRTSLLGPIDKSNAINYLSFRRIPIEYLEDSLYLVELIKTAYQTDLDKAVKLYTYIYTLVIKLMGKEFDKQYIIRILDNITTIPLQFEDFFYLFEKLKKEVIVGNIDLLNLLHYIKLSAEKGFNKEDIVENYYK